MINDWTNQLSHWNDLSWTILSTELNSYTANRFQEFWDCYVLQCNRLFDEFKDIVGYNLQLITNNETTLFESNFQARQDSNISVDGITYKTVGIDTLLEKGNTSPLNNPLIHQTLWKMLENHNITYAMRDHSFKRCGQCEQCRSCGCD